MTKCPICSGDMRNAHPVVQTPMGHITFAIDTCCVCGFGMTVPVPTDWEIYYPPQYYGGRHGVTGDWCIRRRLRMLGDGKGVVLDVGCGDGSFLLAAQKFGWDAFGIERNGNRQMKLGLKVFENLQSGRQALGTNSENQKFDRITLWHSLEHIDRGPELITSLAELLKPNGKILIAVPDNDGWQARLFGPRWLHLDVPRHVHHYTLAALTRVCDKAGLRICRVWHQEFEYDLLGWSQSILNLLFSESNVFFNVLTGKPVRAKGFVKWAQIGSGLILTAVCIPLVWLGTWCGRGGTLIVEAYVQE